MDNNISDTGHIKGSNFYSKRKAKPKSQEGDIEAVLRDEIALSKEAKEKQKVNEWVNLLKEMPDVREDKISDAKKTLKAFEKNPEKVLKQVAEQIKDELS